MVYHNCYKKKRRGGFTLIETLVAILVLAAVVSTILSLLLKSAISFSYSQNQLVALYLAQEGAEYVRNLRDENLIKGENWLNGLDSCKSSNGCYVDVPHDSISPCSSSCPYLKYDLGSYYYNYDTGVETPFIRKINITSINSNEAKIKVDIFWKGRFGQRVINIEENIFNL